MIQLAALKVGRLLLHLLVEGQQAVRLIAIGGLPLQLGALVEDVRLAVDDVQ